MFGTVIIDDEKKARDFVNFLVESYFSDIIVLANASSVVEGIKAITIHKPDIVFLDIKMQDGTGFDVLEAIPKKKFEFIFITAFDQYAIKAFKYSAVDYLIKPIDIDEFISAIARIKERLKTKINTKQHYNALKENIQNKSLTKLVIPSIKGFEYISTSDIVRFEADGRYTKVFLTNKTIVTASKLLREFIDLVDNKDFYRTHKSHLINLKHVKMFIKAEGGSILMTDGSKVSISKNHKDDFLNMMLYYDSEK